MGTKSIDFFFLYQAENKTFIVFSDIDLSKRFLCSGPYFTVQSFSDFKLSNLILRSILLTINLISMYL